MAQQQHLHSIDATMSPFTVAKARREGISVARLRSNTLVRPFRGIRIPVAVDGFEARLRAFAEHRGTDFAFSHTTAALLHGIPLPQAATEAIHVSVPGGCRAPSVRGFVGHRRSRWAITLIDGLPVTSVEHTWLDLAVLLSHDELVVAGDFVVGGRDPLTNLGRLSTELEAAPRRRGTGRARAALEEVRVGSESPGESRLRLCLVRAGLPEPQLNHEVIDENGRFVARADLVYPDARLALEYEGDVHRVDRATWRKDIARRERVEDLGWRMVRVTGDDLRRPDALVARVWRLLESRRPTGPTRCS